MPLNISTSRTYHIEAHIAITVAMPESIPSGNCLANTSVKNAGCTVLDDVFGHIYGAISPNAPNSTPYYAQTDLADFNNYTWSYSTLSSGKWSYSNNTSTSRTSYSNLTYFANVTLRGGFPYYLDFYMDMDASAVIYTTSASMFGDATAGFNASSGGNHITVKWATVR